MTPLLERNEQFVRTYTPAALGLPAAQVLIVTCLDHRIDPAIVLGLQLGDAPIIRNAGGRITQAVIDDIAFLAFLAEQLSGGQGAADTLFEVAVVHHTQCGTGFLADPGFRHQAARGDRPLRGSARNLRRRRPAHHRQGRRGAPAHLTLAFTEGDSLRPRVRHRHRTRHHHS
jgi:carbonic anhydrase